MVVVWCSGCVGWLCGVVVWGSCVGWSLEVVVVCGGL